MPKGRISKRAVDALLCPPTKDRELLWDTDLAGFGVAAFPSGKKVYVAQYRQAGRSRRISLGMHGRFSPDQARSAAKKILGQAEEGNDPIAERQALRGVPTFKEIADEFMAAHVATKRKPRTKESYESLLRLYIFPAVGSMRVNEIRRSDISKLHDGLADHPGLANRALAVVSSVWNRAAAGRDDDLLFRNPAKGIERFAEERREHFLKTEELSRLGDALREAETVGLPYEVDEAGPKAKHAPKPENRRRKIDPFAIAAIRLLVLTGARLREVLHARWDEIDFERGLLNLSSTRSKTGKKSVFLSAAALAVLQALPRVEGNPHVLPGDGIDEETGIGKPRADLKKPWAAITAAAGLSDLRIHDLRHSFASVGAGAGMGLPIIGKLLGHSQPATTARYSHLDADPMHRAVNSIGETITAAMNRQPGAEVTPIRKGAR